MFDKILKNENVSVKFGSENSQLGGYIFVLETEDIDNELKILISGTYLGEKGAGIDEELNEDLKNLMLESYPVYADENKVYEITFSNYITYQVRNESYCSWDDEEICRGNHLLIFEKSKLLEYFLTVTDCGQFENGDFYPAKWQHFGVYSEDHIIDIIACDEPVIRKVCIE